MESSDILVALVSLKWEIKGQVDCSHKVGVLLGLWFVLNM